MKRIVFSSIIVLAAVAATGAVAGVQQPAIEIPEHGLGLLLETPNSPVGDVYSQQPVPT